MLKVIDERKERKTCNLFDVLPIGAIYADAEGDICIKTSACNSEGIGKCIYFINDTWCETETTADEPAFELNAEIKIQGYKEEK